MAFSLLQSKYCGNLVICADLSIAIDLIAVVLNDQSLSVYRTLTWERVVHTKEATPSNTITAIKFCPYGKWLFVGNNVGNVSVLRIDGCNIVNFYTTVAASHFNRVNKLSWVQTIQKEKSVLNQNGTEWIWGGINQVERSGSLTLLNDPCEEENVEKSIEIELTDQMSDILLLVARDTMTIDAFVHGIHMLFTVSCADVFSVLSIKADATSVSLYSGLTNNSEVVIATESASGERIQNAANVAVNFERLVGDDYVWHRRCGFVRLSLSRDLRAIERLLDSCAKRWKDACKPVVPKLSLLQSLLDSYQLNITPTEFMFSVASCGLWHPAAVSSFSQHWNEQGLQRLRSAIDSSSLFVIKQLQFSALPMASNLCLSCRELAALSEKLPSSREILSANALAILHSERLLALLDAALDEARRARDAMLLYLQFIRECSAMAANNAETATKFSGKRYLSLFDPRAERASWKGSSSQAEYVTATHLYAHLQQDGAPPIVAASPSSTDSSSLQKLLKQAEELSVAETIRQVEADFGCLDLPSLSLSNQIKLMMSEFEKASAAALQDRSDRVSSRLRNSADSSQSGCMSEFVVVDSSIWVADRHCATLPADVPIGSVDDDHAQSQFRILYVYIINRDNAPLSTKQELLLLCPAANGRNAVYCHLGLQNLQFGSLSAEDTGMLHFSQVKLYFRPSADADVASTISAVVVGNKISKQGQLAEVSVAKLPLSCLQFNELPTSVRPLPGLVITNHFLDCLQRADTKSCDVQWRDTALLGSVTLWVCGERGVALLADWLGGGKVVVLDLEADEEEEEEEEQEEEEEVEMDDDNSKLSED